MTCLIHLLCFRLNLINFQILQNIFKLVFQFSKIFTPTITSTLKIYYLNNMISYLSNNNLTGTVPSNFSGLPHLQKLWVVPHLLFHHFVFISIFQCYYKSVTTHFFFFFKTYINGSSQWHDYLLLSQHNVHVP